MLERVEVIGGLGGYVVVVLVMFIYIMQYYASDEACNQQRQANKLAIAKTSKCARESFLLINIKSFGYLDLFHTFVVDKLI